MDSIDDTLPNPKHTPQGDSDPTDPDATTPMSPLRPTPPAENDLAETLPGVSLASPPLRSSSLDDTAPSAPVNVENDEANAATVRMSTARPHPGRPDPQSFSSADAPQSVLPPPPPDEPPVAVASSPAPHKRNRLGLWTVFGILALVVIGSLSAFGGYNAGIQDRLAAQSTQVSGELQAQFDLAQQDLAEKRYTNAIQRYEYILQHDPNFPGVIDGMTTAMLALNATATPTVIPTPTLTPTPDLRGVEELFNQSKAALDASDWTAAIDTLLSLRKTDPTYRSVEIDGMLYVALRNRGVDKILRSADLEGGTYDLALAERFGPLDTEARNYRIWVNMYTTAASFWEIDWANAVFYFSQVAPMAPGLTDASGYTALARYQEALKKYGELLAKTDEWCDARDMFETAINAGSADPDLQSLYEKAVNQCDGGGGDDDDEGDNSGDQNTTDPTQEPVSEPSPEPQPTSYP